MLFRVKSENLSNVDNITNNLLHLLHLLQKPENARRTGVLDVVGCVVGSIYNLLQTQALLKLHRLSKNCLPWTVFPVLREKEKNQGMWQYILGLWQYIVVTTGGIFLPFERSGGYTSADPTVTRLLWLPVQFVPPIVSIGSLCYNWACGISVG